MSGFWQDLRRDYASLWPQIRAGWAETREEWWELIAELRQRKQFTHRMWQHVTGKPSPTRADKREAKRAILAEAGELDEIERRLIAEHERGEGQQGT